MTPWTWYEAWLEGQLQKVSYSLSRPRELAKAILELSDAYQDKTTTPWNTRSTVAAYLTYYVPLNIIRSQAVCKILKQQMLLSQPGRFLDFGSGAGTTELSLSLFNELKGSQFDFIEISPVATEIHRSLHQAIQKNLSADFQASWFEQPLNQNTYDWGVFQTSLNELNSPPEALWQCTQLILIEAATSEKARPLMALKDELIKKGYSILAPCTHQLSCPLLLESQRDWCHDRVKTELPSWFALLQPYLPIENLDVTFSYMIASRTQKPEPRPLARVIGDPLWEKGKVRQMVCRTGHREFLSWLRRNGDPQTPRRGDLLECSNWPEFKSQEIRVNFEIETHWTRTDEE